MDANDVTFTRFVPARVVSLAQASASTKQRIASALDQEEEEEAGAGAGAGTAGNKRSPGGGDPLSNNPGKGSGETRDSKWARARERERERDRNDREERRRDRDHHYRGGGGGGGGGGRGGGGGGGRRYRSRSRSRSPDPRRRERRGGDRGGGDKRSPRDPEEIQRQKEEQRAKAAERDARTVFATNLSTRADERDLFEFFSVAGDVMDVRVIMDRFSRRSKGMAYIEYETREGAASALALSGSSFLGQTVQVRGSESEKNLAWESEKREKKAAAATAAVEAGGTAAAGGAAATATGDMQTAGAPGSAARLKSGKLDIANIDPKLTVDKLRTLFEPFGTLEDITLTLTPDGTAASGTVVYASPEDAERAIGSLNGMSLRNRQLIVAAAIEMTNTAPPMPQPHMNQLAGAALQTAAAAAAASAAATSVEVAAAAEAAASDAKQNTKMVEQLEERDGGLKLDSNRRAMLMARLAGGVAADDVSAAAAPAATQMQVSHPDPELRYVQGILGPASPIATPCILLKNLFDPAEETEPEWWVELGEDVREECEAKYGHVEHIHVDIHSKGFVYLRFTNTDAATQAQNALNGRMFAGRQVSAEYQFLDPYIAHFAAAAE